MSTFWLGFWTFPVLLSLFYLLLVTAFRMFAALSRWGITFEAKGHRNLRGVSDYLIRHDIWWERSFGPVFAGGWYHEMPRYREPGRARWYREPPEARVNRWFGIGLPNGPCLMVFRRRYLGGGA